MARENQGLQIALIIFVMLTIVLGVTTFLFFRQFEEADLKAEKDRQEANAQRTAASNIQEENNELKRLMGFPATEKLDAITEKFANDMQTYAANFPEENRFYSPVLAYLHTVIKDANEELAAEQAKVQELKDRNEALEASKDPQIKQHQTAAASAQKDLEAERAKFKDDRERFTADEAKVAASLQKARKEADSALAKVQEKLEETTSRLVKIDQQYKRVRAERDAVVKETFETAYGEIRWVNQRNGTVWINLGRSDGLARHTSFSVYPVNTTDVSGAGKKAGIEVTQILGDHLAEARIVEDDVSNPVMPGDQIHTPVWAPGYQKRFALAGQMDINSDGKSDLDVLRNVITMNGGIIDAEMDNKGKQTGKITVNTRYLVRGEPPDAKGNPAVIAAYTRMIGTAENLGIEQISLDELLMRMGYENKTPVTTFGPGANPNDFRAQPREGGNKVSSGTVSDLFKERRSPARGSRRPSAY